VALFNNSRARITTYRQEVAKLKAAILISIGATIREEISHPTTGFLDISIENIMTSILEHYGTPTEADILRMFNSADAPISSEALFHSEAVRMEATYRRLQDMGHNKPQVQRMEALERACQHLAVPSEAIKDYKRLHPLLNNRSLTDMIEYVAINAPNLRASITSTGYAGSVSAPTTPQPTSAAAAIGHDKIIELAVAAGVAAALAQLGLSGRNAGVQQERQVSNRQTGRGGRGAGRLAGRVAWRLNSERDKTQPSYCFYHGYCGHSSQQCQVMLEDARYIRQ
jgi:hypothetical protein